MEKIQMGEGFYNINLKSNCIGQYILWENSHKYTFVNNQLTEQINPLTSNFMQLTEKV